MGHESHIPPTALPFFLSFFLSFLSLFSFYLYLLLISCFCAFSWEVFFIYRFGKLHPGGTCNCCSGFKRFFYFDLIFTPFSCFSKKILTFFFFFSIGQAFSSRRFILFSLIFLVVCFIIIMFFCNYFQYILVLT